VAQPTHTASKQWHHAPQLYQLSSDALLPAYESTTVLKAIKIATTKIMDDFHYEWKPSHAYHKINTFHGEQR